METAQGMFDVIDFVVKYLGLIFNGIVTAALLYGFISGFHNGFVRKTRGLISFILCLWLAIVLTPHLYKYAKNLDFLGLMGISLKGNIAYLYTKLCNYILLLALVFIILLFLFHSILNIPNRMGFDINKNEFYKKHRSVFIKLDYYLGIIPSVFFVLVLLYLWVFTANFLNFDYKETMNESFFGPIYENGNIIVERFISKDYVETYKTFITTDVSKEDIIDFFNKIEK